MKKHIKKLWQDESAQGATEYILMLVIVVGVAFMFRRRLMELLGTKLDQLSGDITGFTSQ